MSTHGDTRTVIFPDLPDDGRQELEAALSDLTGAQAKSERRSTAQGPVTVVTLRNGTDTRFEPPGADGQPLPPSRWTETGTTVPLEFVHVTKATKSSVARSSQGWEHLGSGPTITLYGNGEEEPKSIRFHARDGLHKRRAHQTDGIPTEFEKSTSVLALSEAGYQQLDSSKNEQTRTRPGERCDPAYFTHFDTHKCITGDPPYWIRYARLEPVPTKQSQQKTYHTPVYGMSETL